LTPLSRSRSHSPRRLPSFLDAELAEKQPSRRSFDGHRLVAVALSWNPSRSAERAARLVRHFSGFSRLCPHPARLHHACKPKPPAEPSRCQFFGIALSPSASASRQKPGESWPRWESKRGGGTGPGAARHATLLASPDRSIGAEGRRASGPYKPRWQQAESARMRFGPKPQEAGDRCRQGGR
jgi:hypothetical protein